jgi:hypothetical protein
MAANRREERAMTTPVLWKAETQVNTTDAAVGAGGTNFQMDGQVVGVDGGGYVVAWTDSSRAYNSNGPTVVAQQYDSQGNRVGGEVSLRDTPFPGAAWEFSPAITYFPSSSPDWLGRGEVAVAYVDRWINDAGAPTFIEYHWGIIVEWYSPSLGVAGGGDLFFYTMQLNFPAYALSDPSITAFNQGGYAVAYTVNDGAHTRIVGQVRPAHDLPGAQFNIHSEADDAGHSALATLSNGNFVAVFEDEFNGSAADIDIRYRILTPGGSGVTGSNFVPGASGGAAETVPDVAALAGGGFVVAWTDAAGDADGNGIRATILDNAGGTVRADIAVNTGTAGSQFAPNLVTLAEGGFLVSWQDGGAGALRGQRFDALGNAMGAEFTVRNQATPWAPDTALLQDGRIAYATDDYFTGDPDVVTSIWNPRGNMAALGDVLWRHNGGTAATGLHDLAIVPNTWQTRGTGNFDGDGDSDILWHHDGGTVLTWEMQGGNYVANHHLGVVSNSWHIAGTGNFDGDGDSDIVWHHDGGTVVTWEMQGGAYVANHSLGVVSNSWRIAGTGNFDGDGDSDILWRHDGGTVVTWEMQGGAYLVNHNLGVVSNSWRIAGTGDFDGDGDADILWRHDGGQAVTWEMQGGNYVTNHNLPVVPTTWQIRGAEDFDSDGDADILWRHDGGTVVTWDMQGGNLVGTHNFGVVTNDWQIRGTGEFDLL